MKIRFFLLCLYVFFPFGICGAATNRPSILVSVSAYRDIVQEMVGDGCDVRSVVPPGTSFHTFDPTPGQMDELHHASLWFIIGEPFEKKILGAFEGTSSVPVVVDLRNGVSLLHDQCCHCCDGTADPHIWTSPRMMKTELKTIRDGIQLVFGDMEDGLDARFHALQAKCDALIAYADAQLEGYQGKVVIIAHAAYGYLCHEYGIQQLSVESGGKEATVRSVENMVKEAKRMGVKTVFSLAQYPKKGIERVATILGAKIVQLNAYQADYFAGEAYAVRAFHDALEEERE